MVVVAVGVGVGVAVVVAVGVGVVVAVAVGVVVVVVVVVVVAVGVAVAVAVAVAVGVLKRPAFFPFPKESHVAKASTAVSSSSPDSSSPYKVGTAYFVRTVTMHVLGRLERVYEHELVLSDAAWVSDSGRFHDVLKTGKFEGSAEIEPFVKDVIVGRGAIVDATEWPHPLPREQR